MPRKAKEEIIEISKEVTEKKTPVKKAAKTTKKESAKKTTATASKTAKTEKIAKTESKTTAKKTANKEAEETIKKTTRRAKSVETKEKSTSKKSSATTKKKADSKTKADTTAKTTKAKKTARKTSTAESKATTKKSTSTTKKADSTTKADTTAETTKAKKTTATKTKPKTAAKSATKKASTTRKTKKTKADLEKTAADVENNLALENAENEATEKVNVVEYYDLPYRYNQTIVKILAQTPNILFVYWDISDDDRNNFVSQYGENFFNNTVPVLLVINKTMNYSYEVQINDFANSWYLHVNDANCEYQVELGRRNKEGSQNYYPDYYYVTTSNELDMPNDHILLENIPNNVLFKNIKTQELVEKPIVNIKFFKDFARSKDFYKYFKELLNDELEGDGINLNLPSSHTSSSFK